MTQLPSFIVIGAGKSGTTSLHQYLSQHPQIYLCPQKETFYFTSEKNRANHAKYGAIQTFEDYAALFADAAPTQAIGEISTTYYAHPQSASLIHDLLPTVKILAILRNPIERAFSDYQMHVNEGHEKRSFEKVMEPDVKYVKSGFYYAQLKPYFELFDSSQIKIWLYEDYCQNIHAFLASFFTFIDVDPHFQPDTSQRGRVGGVPKRQWVRHLLNEKNPIRTVSATALKTVMPLATRQRIRAYLLRQNTQRLDLDPTSYAQLAAIYRDDILQLQDLLHRDCSHWLTPGAKL